MTLAAAAIRIKVPHELAVVLAIAGGVIVAVILLLLFFSRFGKKGVIVVGVVALLLGGVATAAYVSRWRESTRLVTLRVEHVRGTVGGLRTLAQDAIPASRPLRDACAAVDVGRGAGHDLFFTTRDAAQRPRMKVAVHTPNDSGKVEEVDTAALFDDDRARTADLGPFLGDGLLIVFREGSRQGKSWRGTVAVSNPATGARCVGLVDVPTSAGDPLQDSSLRSAVYREVRSP